MSNYSYPFGKKIAKYLLDIQAVQLRPQEPFTWASGWKSPIYCDNRKILSYTEIRNFIKEAFLKLIQELYPEVECIAGVATGAIAISAVLADDTGLPYVYVRPEPKGHGLGNQIEGVIKPKEKTVIVEDLVSTGKSSLLAYNALKASNVDICGMVAIFSYGFETATINFKEAGCQLTTLTNYDLLIETALSEGYIKSSDMDALRKWRIDPANYK